MKNILSRKFIMASVCLLMVYSGFLLGKISTEIFMPFVLGILGIYTSGNVISNATTKLK